MKIDITATGKTVEEALENAKKELGIDILEGVEFEILDQPKKTGLFGLKSTPARVRLYSNEEEDILADVLAKPEKKVEKKAEKADVKTVKTEAKVEAKTEAKAQKPAEKKNNSKKNAKAKPMAEEKPMPVLDSTAEELQGDAALVFVRKLLSDLEINARAEMYIDEENMRRVLIYGEDACSLIGHHGETLNAFQYLANLAVIRASKQAREAGEDADKSRVTVDIENYRAKREATLRALARRMAHKALKYRRSVMLEPMNPYERRIIHSEIQKIDGVSTNSIGAENNRKIVIYLTDSKEQ
ncbi:MAG: Jag N-terminal domain-containing protein [Clostridia bacterium]|nr:Jag N-terminal domain-containing protein [Clostridia bacterium]